MSGGAAYGADANTSRLFVAIRLPAHIRQRIVDATVPLRQIAEVRWVAIGQLHVTLRFVGKVGGARVDVIRAAIADAIPPLPPFRVRLAAGGAFPSARRPRVVWIGVHSSPPLRQLHQAVEQGVVDAGVTPDTKPFRPHVTLGRVRRGRAPGALSRWIDDLSFETSFEVARVSLMNSRFQTGVARHTEVAGIDLAPSNSPDARHITT